MLAANVILGIDYDFIDIQRTPEGKPYLVTNSNYPGFNFNTSHHGDYVTLVAEPYCLMGVDVMSHDLPSSRAQAIHPENFFRSFRRCFTPYEWSVIRSAGPEPEYLYDQFYRHWCMKEAYTKAVGVGLSFDFKRIEFHYIDGIWDDEAKLFIDGCLKVDWRFFLHKLGSSHWVCVARGPFTEATQSFKLHFPEVKFDKTIHDSAISMPEKPFSRLGVLDLVPRYRLDEYVQIVCKQK